MRLLLIAGVLFLANDAPWWAYLLYVACWWIDAKVWEATQ